jgi:sec-independent protein translocase protein TatA
MFGNLSGWHLIILLIVILLLFGAPKLPGLARSLGQSMRIFRSEVKTMKDENSPDSAAGESTNSADSADSSGTKPPKP